MKTLIFIFVIILTLTEVIAQPSGWFFQNPRFTNMGIEDIEVFNSNTAYVIGGLSTFMKTTDAGLSWSNGLTSSTMSGMTPERLYALSFINLNTGWAVGYNNGQPPLRIFKTTNAGSFWTRQGLSLGNGNLMDVFFINENTGWTVGNNRIFKTTDGGQNWIPIQLPNNGQMEAVFFMNANTGFLAGENWAYKSYDGGLSWSICYYAVNSQFYDFKFINENTGFLAGRQNGYARMLKTTNAGNSWSVKYSSSGSYMYHSVTATSPNVLIAVGGNFYSDEEIIKSTDNGETWTEVNTNIPMPTILMSTAFFNATTGLAFGANGKMLRTIDGGANWNSLNPYVFNTSVNSVKFANVQTGWLMSGYGKLLQTTNGGTAWTTIMELGNYYSLEEGYFWGNLYYILTINKFFRSSNSGFSWDSASFARTIRASDFVDQNNGFLFGYDSQPYWTLTTFYRTSNGGISWDTTTNSPVTVPLPVMDFVNSQTGYIAAGNSAIQIRVLKTTNRGINWNEINTGLNKRPQSICFVNENTGWISCEYNSLLRTTNGGLSWQILTFGIPDSWYSPEISFANSNTGWVIVTNPSAQILKSTNGGLNWYIQFDCGVANLNTMFFLNENTGWAAGTNTLLRTTNGGEYLSINSLSGEIPASFVLSQNYPNPFNPQTSIKFALPPSPSGEGSEVRLVVYDILGCEITTLVNEKLSPGTYEVTWDASNYPSGVYFYQLTAGDYNETKKMILIK